MIQEIKNKSMETKQVHFWKGEFGKEYTDRNSFKDFQTWDQNYVVKYGVSRVKMFEDFIGDLDRESKILEIGCNTGMQLRCLQTMGFKHLYGVELQQYAVEQSKQMSEGLNIIQGSGFDVPFKDGFFDLVMVNGVLIHISPDDLSKFMSEVVRCSNHLVMGIEYYSPELQAINYRGNEGYLWKADYKQIYLDQFPNMKIKKSQKYAYIAGNAVGNEDDMFLLEK